MKIAIIGSGLIGSQVTKALVAAGHDARAHSLSTGVNLLTGAGLEAAVRDAEVVVDLTNSPTFDEAALDFFGTTVPNLLSAAEKADAKNVVALSIVGVDQLPELAYYRAKTAQEDLISAGPVPYSIVRATQFMEFVPAVLDMTTDGDVVRLPTTPIQPIASADVAAAVVEVVTGAPLLGRYQVGGPEVFALDELGRITLAATGDRRTVVTDETAGMFAAAKGDVLTTHGDAHLAPTRYRDWLSTR